MKKRILYFLILTFPFLGMIMTNEIIKLNKVEKGYNYLGVTAINTSEKFKSKCSWACHNNTKYCKANHVKFVKPYFDDIDPIYFGIIHSLKSTGNYGLVNVLFLMVLIPLIMYLLLIKSINIQIEISNWRESQ